MEILKIHIYTTIRAIVRIAPNDVKALGSNDRVDRKLRGKHQCSAIGI
jgi:hypothetical protein